MINIYLWSVGAYAKFSNPNLRTNNESYGKSRFSSHFLLKPGLNGQQPMDTDGKLEST
ncbi:MAG: hypothetical protein RMY34_01560 [Aulosira sp. DedQUE10]|nr:hypothetical protein [Aulosira sp. DedQUE10]